VDYCCESMRIAFERWDYTFYRPIVERKDGSVGFGGPAFRAHAATRGGGQSNVGVAFLYMLYCPFCGAPLQDRNGRAVGSEESEETSAMEEEGQTNHDGSTE